MKSTFRGDTIAHMLVVERLKSVNDANFAAVWQLYEHAFPLSEQRPYAYQALAMQDRQDFVCLHLSDVCGFVGLLFYWNLSHCLYVEHLAIMEGRRGQGLGSRALRYVHSLGLPVVLEIEKVVDAPTHQRLLFYERCGYCRLPFAHVQMPFAPQLPPVPMELLSFPYAMTETEVLRFKAFLETTIMRYRERSVDS